MRMRQSKSGAFTLVELLVVIGIIALLVGILLPALSKARRAAQSAQCLANLRSIGQAVFLYTNQNAGWLPGSGATTGEADFVQPLNPASPALAISATAVPPGVPQGAPIFFSDYFAPLIPVMGLNWVAYNTNDLNATDRYAEYMSMPQFQCPSNLDFLVGPTSTGPSAGTLPGISYFTAWAMLLMPGSSAGVVGATTMDTNTQYFPILPAAYAPKMSKIENTSNKIFAADGAKSFTVTAQATYDLTVKLTKLESTSGNTLGSYGPYTDLGAWSMISSALDRRAKKGNSGGATVKYDPRVAAYRHGSGTNFRLNAVFFDGHAGTLDELDSANPAYWLPTGSTLPLSAGIDADVISAYGINPGSSLVP